MFPKGSIFHYKLMSSPIKNIINRFKIIKKPILKLYLLLIKKLRKPISSHPVAIFNIELTNKCLMKCIMCPRTYQMTREQGFMDFDVFKKIINELVESTSVHGQNEGIWLHHFGESLLHPEFDSFIRYAENKKVKTKLSLNPLVLSEENILKILSARPFSLVLSIDGHDNDSFSKIRGVMNGYDKSIDNIMEFLKLKEKHNPDVLTVLSIINFKENEDSITKMKSYWDQVDGIDEVLVKPFVYWDGNIEEINKLEANSEELICDNMVTCNKPWETMTVLWNGDLVPCCFDYNGKYVLGNLKDNSLEDLWNCDKMINLRKNFIENNVSNPLCQSCRQLHSINL